MGPESEDVVGIKNNKEGMQIRIRAGDAVDREIAGVPRLLKMRSIFYIQVLDR